MLSLSTRSLNPVRLAIVLIISPEYSALGDSALERIIDAPLDKKRWGPVVAFLSAPLPFSVLHRSIFSRSRF